MVATHKPAWATVTGPLTQTERDTIEALAEKDYRCYRIAATLKRKPSCIYYHMLVRGMIEPKLVRNFTVYTRKGKEVRSFSPEEDARLEAERAKGRTFHEMAKVWRDWFGHPRCSGTLRMRCIALAAKAE